MSEFLTWLEALPLSHKLSVIACDFEDLRPNQFLRVGEDRYRVMRRLSREEFAAARAWTARSLASKGLTADETNAEAEGVAPHLMRLLAGPPAAEPPPECGYLVQVGFP